MQALEAVSDRAFAEVGLAGNRRVGGVKPAGFIVEEIEQEDMQDLQAAGADGAAMHAWLVGLPVKFPARCQSLTASFLGSGVNWTGFAVLSLQTGNGAYEISDLPGRPGRIRWKNVGMSCRVLGCAEAPLRRATGRSSPTSKWGLLFCRRYTRLGLPAPILCISG